MSAVSPLSHVRARHDRNTTLGVAAGVGAGAVWGLVFLAPELVGTFSPLQLSVARYFFYGLIAAALLIPRWRSLSPRISREQWLSLTWLSLAGNTLYYVLLSYAVQLGGIAMTSLVIGFLPVAVTIIGSRDAGAVSLRKLLPSLALCAAGTVCIGWQALESSNSASAGEQFSGLLCAIGALASWTAYAVGNARCLAQLKNVSSDDWNLLTGIVTGAQSIVLLPVAISIGSTGHSNQEWLQFIGVAIGIAALASVVGNSLWNRASRLLPLTLIGQMILFETLFALAYGLLWEQRLPTGLEVAALVFVILSVLSCLAAHSKTSASAPA